MKKKSFFLPLEKILTSQGFGSRRYCRELIESNQVKIHGVLKTDPNELVGTEDLILEIQGESWAYQEKIYLALHKPIGYECSHQTTHHPSVYGLLPRQFINRGIQCVGRLDQDTSGLILLSDDGSFIHALTSPKKNIGKTYEITSAEPITENQIQELLTGVLLRHESEPAQAIKCLKISENHLNMTITEGRYHQVKRMLAAVGNKVSALHRSSIGSYVLPEDLPPGNWRFLSEIDRNFEC
jgi:16S rRNA pseudouridine516 synthase